MNSLLYLGPQLGQPASLGGQASLFTGKGGQACSQSRQVPRGQVQRPQASEAIVAQPVHCHFCHILLVESSHKPATIQEVKKPTTSSVHTINCREFVAIIYHSHLLALYNYLYSFHMSNELNPFQDCQKVLHNFIIKFRVQHLRNCISRYGWSLGAASSMCSS